MPRYLVWEVDGVIWVEVEEGLSEWVIWDIVEGEMIKTFDQVEQPF